MCVNHLLSAVDGSYIKVWAECSTSRSRKRCFSTLVSSSASSGKLKEREEAGQHSRVAQQAAFATGLRAAQADLKDEHTHSARRNLQHHHLQQK